MGEMQETMTKEAKIAQIKREAAERINELLPAWKQSNFNARAVELNAIRHEREWNEQELTEWQSMLNIWQAIKQVRLDSDAAESAVNALQTIEEIEAFSW